MFSEDERPVLSVLTADGMEGREAGIRHEVLRTQHRPDWTLVVTAPRRPEFNRFDL
jgi:hypothetical protein